MKSRIEEVLSRILSEKHDANITIRFKERQDEQRRDNYRTGGTGSNARKRVTKTEKANSST